MDAVVNETAGRLPNFLYIGPDKAGSSWLHEVLLQHPQIFLTSAKDLYFFDRYYDKGVDWYRSHFRQATPRHDIVGEVCQDYLFHPEAAVRIYNDLDSVRLMVTLREPAARAFSSYLYMLKHGEDVGTFRQALHSRPELLEHGRYGTALQRFLRHFPRDSIHIALFDDLQRDPQRFVDDVTDWLSVDRMELEEGLLSARLPASEARFVALARLARRAAVWVREHDGAELVGRLKRSPWVQGTLYRPLIGEQHDVSQEDADYVWRQLSDELDLTMELTGVDVRGAWARSDPPTVV